MATAGQRIGLIVIDPRVGVIEQCGAGIFRHRRNTAQKKEQGAKPCSKNCVDPISPKNWI
jgi:hypothetical protein